VNLKTLYVFLKVFAIFPQLPLLLEFLEVGFNSIRFVDIVHPQIRSLKLAASCVVDIAARFDFLTVLDMSMNDFYCFR
jgi:hypothetical protein